jgi:allophanate hydrolase subunit 2
MKKIKSDIDLIKYTLNSQSTSTAVARGGVSGGAVVPSAQLDALRAMIESTNTDLTELEIATNTVKNQLHVLKDDLSNQQLTVVASSKKLENEIGNEISSG